jgi:hypothetical protein
MKFLPLIFTFAFLSCGQNETKQKELELKEKELSIKQQELDLKQKESQVQQTQTKEVTKPEVKSTNTAQPSKSKAAEYSYTGKIGSFPVHLQFSTTGTVDCPRGGNTFEGWYYYDKKGENNKIKIKGEFCGSSITFSEYNEKGVSTGDFSGLWGGTELDGHWTGNNRTYEFHLVSSD